MTIRDLVLEESGLTPVFEKYGIDYCCAGDETLDAACKKRGLNFDGVNREVEMVRRVGPHHPIHPSLWDLEFLVDYIVKNHHRYLRESIPVLTVHLQKLNREDGLRYPYIKQVAMLFTKTVQGFELHMRKEEMLLFPYIKSLESAREVSRPKPTAPLLSLEVPIEHMQDHHVETTQAFSKIRALLSDYTVPPGASSTHLAVIHGLRDFEIDIHQHLHLENNILFHRALELERSFDHGMIGHPPNHRASESRIAA